MTWTNGSDGWCYLGTSSSDYNVSVPRYTDLIISAYLKVNNGNGNVQLYARLNSDGSYKGTSKTIPLNTWTRVYCTINTGNATKILVRFDNDGYTGSNSAMSIDGVMVEVASAVQVKPSPFSLPTVGLADKNLSNVTTIDGGKITTDTIGATQINTASLKTSNLFIDNILASNDFSNINGPGFRLKANAAGTSTDPTIYGAYIKGAELEAARIKENSLITNSANTHTGIPVVMTGGTISNSTWDLASQTVLSLPLISFGSSSSTNLPQNVWSINSQILLYVSGTISMYASGSNPDLVVSLYVYTYNNAGAQQNSYFVDSRTLFMPSLDNLANAMGGIVAVTIPDGGYLRVARVHSNLKSGQMHTTHVTTFFSNM